MRNQVIRVKILVFNFYSKGLGLKIVSLYLLVLKRFILLIIYTVYLDDAIVLCLKMATMLIV